MFFFFKKRRKGWSIPVTLGPALQTSGGYLAQSGPGVAATVKTQYTGSTVPSAAPGTVAPALSVSAVPLPLQTQAGGQSGSKLQA